MCKGGLHSRFRPLLPKLKAAAVAYAASPAVLLPLLPVVVLLLMLLLLLLLPRPQHMPPVKHPAAPMPFCRSAIQWADLRLGNRLGSGSFGQVILGVMTMRVRC